MRLSVSHVIPAAPRPADTEWLKHVRIQSRLLTQYWGRPVFINAAVLLPLGYDSHPDTYYPTVYPLGHAPVPFRFTPDSGAEGRDGEPHPTEVRRGARINPTSGLESGYDFYKSWTSSGFPRVIAITLEQATPYFPDSYSVNSANDGPYGDAIVQEVIPYLEEHFRIIRKPYARQLEGASGRRSRSSCNILTSSAAPGSCSPTRSTSAIISSPTSTPTPTRSRSPMASSPRSSVRSSAA